MKKLIWCHLILLAFCSVAAQEVGIPNWFIQEMEAEIGTWVGDNSNYKSEQEPIDAYALNWRWGINNKSIIGKLYGVKDGKELGTYWEFRKYWDAEKKLPVIIQFGADGTVGIGHSFKKSEKKSELVQVFTNPDGAQYKMGHKIIVLDSLSHIGTSFLINELGEWTKLRSYTWEKADKSD